MTPPPLLARSGLACLCLASLCVAALAGDAEATRSQRRWSSARQASEGPMLDPPWFENRKAVVYLIPAGGLNPIRRIAAAVMTDLWTAGDWDTKHIFVGGVPNAAVFIIGKQVGLNDAIRRLTEANGQGEEAYDENEKIVLQHVFFVHDRKASLWQELGAHPDESAPVSTDPEEKPPIAVVVLDRGHVVGVIPFDAARESADPASPNSPAHVAAEVRRLLSSPAESAQ